MKSENIFLVILGAILKMAAIVGIVYYIYRGAGIAYDYGYRILNEPAVSSGEGRMVTIQYTEGMSALDFGKMMEEKGLSRDGRLFALQYLFSEYREEMKAGTYEVSTAMTAEEIMAAMAASSGDKDTGKDKAKGK